MSEPPDDDDEGAWRKWFEEQRRERFFEITDWDALSARLATVEEPSDAERLEAADALAYLRSELGDGYLRRLVHEEAHVEFLTNLAPWPWRELIGFARAVRIAAQLKGFASLRARLRAGRSHSEGGSVLEVAAKLTRAGHRVQFDPPVRVGMREKVPDLGVATCNGNTTEYVEVSRLGPSHLVELCHRTTEVVMELMLLHRVLVAGQFHRPLRPEEEEGVSCELAAIMRRVHDARSVEVIDRPGLCLLLVASEDREAEYDAWRQERQLMTGPGASLPDDVLGRLTGKLRKEQEQLPQGGHGVVFIQTHGAAMLLPNWSELARALEVELVRYPHVAGLVVSQSMICCPADEGMLEVGPHRLVTRCRSGLIQEKHLVVAAPGHGDAWLVNALATALREH